MQPTETEKIIAAINDTRAQSKAEHTALSLKVDKLALTVEKIDRGIYGDGDNASGIMIKVNTHHALLRPALMYMKVFKEKPLLGIGLFFAGFHGMVYMSFKGLDKVLTLLKILS